MHALLDVQYVCIYVAIGPNFIYSIILIVSLHKRFLQRPG